MPQKWVEDEEFKNRIIKNLQYLGITHPERVLKNYPHQLSGGEKQRILITMSLLCRPRLLIADEPTSSLDANNKILILNELYRLNQERQVTLLIITHDLAILSDMVGRIMVMYGGRMVELGKAIEIYTNPKHPYTQLLVDLMKGDFSSVEKTNWRTKEDNLCPFLPRCRYHKVICTKENPPLINISVSHLLSCWLEID
jgi:oligopeptide/dipeptide ABC transporter ATP-binding protein